MQWPYFKGSGVPVARGCCTGQCRQKHHVITGSLLHNTGQRPCGSLLRLCLHTSSIDQQSSEPTTVGDSYSPVARPPNRPLAGRHLLKRPPAPAMFRGLSSVEPGHAHWQKDFPLWRQICISANPAFSKFSMFKESKKNEKKSTSNYLTE